MTTFSPSRVAHSTYALLCALLALTCMPLFSGCSNGGLFDRSPSSTSISDKVAQEQRDKDDAQKAQMKQPVQREYDEALYTEKTNHRKAADAVEDEFDTNARHSEFDYKASVRKVKYEIEDLGTELSLNLKSLYHAGQDIDKAQESALKSKYDHAVALKNDELDSLHAAFKKQYRNLRENKDAALHALEMKSEDVLAGLKKTYSEKMKVIEDKFGGK